jgi:coenzyme Q-binding protein COQ10
MFGLVADIEKYPEFLPWCTGAHIVERKESELVADLVIGYGPLHETYTSRVVLERQRKIEVVGIRGPFRFLENSWAFSGGPKGCKVEFAIDFAFKSFVLKAMMGAVFHRAVHHMVESFEGRARDLFGAAREQPPTKERRRGRATASGR